ncbi:NACHT, LRR and PYD domains-containing protein 4 [Nannospalax galili]|uniref:Uncharacterized protein n=1 Tax=Nannospalax galili TaxID=1026970 RepID=A0A8C6QCB9_NANGA|nr:NACHT, LRR and PYD domains-containing protein 4 [Nannospalax galili]
MASSFFSDFGLMWYLEELNKKEFMKFKELLKQEILHLGLKHIPRMEVKKASREDLANLLMKYYEEKQAWNVTFEIFQKINRLDLCERAAREIAGHPKIYQAHIKTKFIGIWSRKFTPMVHDFFDQEITQEEHDYFEYFFPSKTTGNRSHILLLKGVPGIGKTMMLTKLMLAWAEGKIYQNKFTYVFYFCCQEVKPLTTSLSELISREWPNPSAPIAEIMSQPEKLLFIIDSFEWLRCDLTEPESELCTDWIEERPMKTLLSSLFRRKILPESSLLIAGTPESLQTLENKFENPEIRTIIGFDESNRKLFFRCLFPDKYRAQEAYGFVRENEQLFTICQIPLLCWVVAMCLKQEMEKGNDLTPICRSTTSLYVAYILNLFLPRGTCYPSKKSQEQLQGLCSLAAEGLWTDTFVFSEEALRRNGLVDSDVPVLLNIKILVKSRESENSYTFLHPSVQEFCAAVFYLLKRHVDHPSTDVKCIDILLIMFLKKAQARWIFVGCFIFGLLHEIEQEKLRVFFGCQISKERKQQLHQCLETLSKSEELWEQVDCLKLFYCLFELRNEAFVIQAMDLIQEVKFEIKDNSDLIVSAYCLKHCTALKKLSISVRDILRGDQAPKSMANRLICWHQICSVLTTNENLQVLQVKNSGLNESAFMILYNQLRHPNCPLQVLEINNVSFFCDNHLFFEVFLQNPNLKHLNLSLTVLSHSDVKLLCDVLNHPESNIEKLLLTDCNLSSSDFEIFAPVLISNKTLKHLNIGSNHLDKGIQSLCQSLCSQNCILKFLVLANCHLSDNSWGYIREVLLTNKTLSHLDLSSNSLKDEGLKILCEALSLPESGLKSLCLRNCLITASGCQDLAAVLRSNGNLRSLQISENKVKDAGVKLLCDAVKHPNCHLENLGLEACELTGACCEDLASAFTQSETLWGLNLLENTLDSSGVIVLCEALKQPKCNLHVLGLRVTDFDEETQAFLIAEEERNPYLTIISNV